MENNFYLEGKFYICRRSEKGLIPVCRIPTEHFYLEGMPYISETFINECFIEGIQAIVDLKVDFLK